MARNATRLSDMLENEWSESVALLGWSAGVLTISSIVIYFAKKIMEANRPVGWFCFTFGFLGVLFGIALLLVAAKRAIQIRRKPTVSFACPYCGTKTSFLTAPTEDFTCEGCNRDVHFTDGEPVAVRTIVCQACKAEHKVAVTVQRYVCDRCNRPLRITANADYAAVMAGLDSGDDEEGGGQNYDVLLISYDHRKENEIAFKLQNILIINNKETHRLMHTASSSSPLIVGQNLTVRKAEAIRRQLQDLGATATLRPTTIAGAGAKR